VLAWLGEQSFDIVVAIRRGEGQTKPTVRAPHPLAVSETSDTLVIDLTDRGYVGLGTEGTVAVLEAERVILDRLPILPCLKTRVAAETDYDAALPLEAVIDNQHPPIARTVAQEHCESW
jgi:hypothetical protein